MRSEVAEQNLPMTGSDAGTHRFVRQITVRDMPGLSPVGFSRVLTYKVRPSDDIMEDGVDRGILPVPVIASVLLFSS